MTIILSEITPRRNQKDVDVKRCNELRVKKDYITLAYHSNLRNDRWSHYDDDKHISKYAVAIFAANLKRALRKAHGITLKYPMININGFINTSPVNFVNRSAPNVYFIC